MKKKLLLSISCLLMSAGIFAAAIPGALSLKGSALNESSNAMQMKKVGNTYELYTSLKTGSYSFEGDNSVQGGEVTVEGNNVPYYIGVNYDGDQPVVTVSKIDRLTMWAPWFQYTIAELEYAGNSTFKAVNLVHNRSLWGGDHDDDARYRFRVFLENGRLITYASAEENSNELKVATNDQWSSDEFGPAIECGLPLKYIDSNDRFQVELRLKSGEDYIHFINDYDFNPVINPCDEVFIEGTAIAPGKATLKEKSYGIFEFVGELQAGKYKIRGTRAGTNAYFFNEESKLVEKDQEITFESEKGSYYIKVDFVDATYEISPVTSLVWYMSEKTDDEVEFTYSGNGVYKGVIEYLRWPETSYGKDERYKFRMTTESGTVIHWGGSISDPERPDSNTSEDYYKLYSVVADRFMFPFKFKEGTDRMRIDMTITFYTDGNYSHSYTVSPSVGIEKIKDDQVSIYPTVIENDLTVSLEKAGFSVELVSLAGVTVLKAETTSNELILTDIAQPKSIYLLKVVQDGKIVTVKRIVKL